ncbi:MAG: MFS transporter [Caulobacteraceae bacterium]
MNPCVASCLRIGSLRIGDRRGYGRPRRGPAFELPDWRKFAIFLVMAVGQFMALLDIQIVVASMSSIQGGLSASQDEIDWIQTAYLMAEIVMIPLSAYLAQALSTRWVFVASAALFTLTSLFCGGAWDLPSMMVFRAIQGFVGGAMIPLAFSTGFTFFDGRRRRSPPPSWG